MGGSAPAQLMGGYLLYTDDYSFHQKSFFDTYYTGYNGGSASANDVASVVKNVVLWGSNALSTVNSSAYSEIRSVEMMKERGGKVWFIGPEFVDTGVTLADTWVQMKPYTDTAVILGMIYHAIDTTFNKDGSIKAGGLLDVNYVDTMVYGFFDSPEYWVNKDTGAISFTDPSDGSVKVNAVPAGKSLSAYIMGNDDRLTKAKYEGNYVANQFKTKQATRNLQTCSYTAKLGNKTVYNTKLDYNTPKTPEWAEKISGVPAETIKDLAKLYFTPANHPIYSEWCGAQQKQANGVINMFALQTLLILSKTWGQTGDGLGRAFGGSRSGAKGTLSVKANRSDIPSNPQSPVISCTQWHNAIKFAFGDQLKANGYKANHIPDWSEKEIGTGKVYHDDGGAKSLFKWVRDESGKVKQRLDGYYEYEKDASGNPIYSGIRFLLNTGGNIPMNQHMNPNDAREMFEALDLGTKNPNDADTFCMVTFDNFLSPSARWSDYVLPAATTWEQEDLISISLGNTVYIPVVSNPPGQAKSQWNFTNELLKAVEKVDPSKSGIATKFTCGKPNQQIEDIVKEAFGKATQDQNSLYYKKTWQEFLDNPYAPKTAAKYTPSALTKSELRENLDTYLAGAMSDPFISKINTLSATQKINGDGYGDFGVQWDDLTNAPAPSSRFHVYSDMLVWRYEKRYSAWHGYFKDKKQPTGQANKDMEGDALVYPIPMYYAYEDYFKEAYGYNQKELPAKGYLLTTTHDRYRAHSSQAENPYLRELTHRIKDGGLYSGNDWLEYGNSKDIQEVSEGDTVNMPRLNQTMRAGAPLPGKEKIASWTEVWMNDIDARDEGIRDGQLITIGNPVGDVRAIARVTDRVVRGFIGLHQGCWYDPDPVDGVDDGGCANTVMAQRPSRVDHGNGQQSAMVWIKSK